MVLIRMIMGYVFLVFFAVVAFIAYALVYGWGEAIALALRIAVNDFARIVMWLPFVLAWFSDKRRGRDPLKDMPLGVRQLVYGW